MGYLTLNGKRISKPFVRNGKKVVKITSGSKTLTLEIPKKWFYYQYHQNGSTSWFRSGSDSTSEIFVKALVASLSGNGNTYHQNIYSTQYRNYELKYLKDTGYSSTSNLVESNFPSLDKDGEEWEIKIKSKVGSYIENTSGWDEYWLKIRRINNKLQLDIGNFLKAIWVDIGIGNWHKIKEFSHSGGWNQVYVRVNSDFSMTVGLGGGSGVHNSMAVFISGVRKYE